MIVERAPAPSMCHADERQLSLAEDVRSRGNADRRRSADGPRSAPPRAACRFRACCTRRSCRRRSCHDVTAAERRPGSAAGARPRRGPPRAAGWHLCRARLRAMVFEGARPCQPARAMYRLPVRTITVFFFDEVTHRDAAADHARKRRLAAVLDQPLGAHHGGGAVLALGPELALAVTPQAVASSSWPRRSRCRPSGSSASRSARGSSSACALRLPDLEDAAVEDRRVGAAAVVTGGHDRHAALECVDGRPDRELGAIARRAW